MRNYLGLTSLLLVAFLLLACNDKTEKVAANNQAPTPVTLENTPNVEQEVMAFLKQLEEANSKKDIGFYDRVLVPEYLYTSNGRTWTKAQVLEGKKNLSLAGDTDMKSENNDMRVKAYGNVVVVTGQQTVSYKDKQGKQHSESGRNLIVLTKSDGQYRLVAASDSAINPKADSK